MRFTRLLEGMARLVTVLAIDYLASLHVIDDECLCRCLLGLHFSDDVARTMHRNVLFRNSPSTPGYADLYLKLLAFSLLRCPISTNAIEGHAYGFSEPTSSVEVLRELHIIVSRKVEVWEDDRHFHRLNLEDFYEAAHEDMDIFSFSIPSDWAAQ